MIEKDCEIISKWVRDGRFTRIQNLSSKVNQEALLFVHNKMDGRKALGIDGVSKAEYEKDLYVNLGVLVDKLKRDSYNPKPSRKVQIPKGNGKTRPLGISCYEDKIVEATIARLLNAVYEPKFKDCSYGFRPGRSQHDAIRELRKIIMTRKVNYIVEADIKSFFDTLDHEWLIKFLEHNIADKKLMRLIRKFLNAGVMENGELMDKTE